MAWIHHGTTRSGFSFQILLGLAMTSLSTPYPSAAEFQAPASQPNYDEQPAIVNGNGGRERSESPWRCQTFAPKNWGYINSTGKVVIDLQFELAFNFQEGLATIKQGGKYGYIDKTGRFVIEPKFDFASSFHEGFASVGNRQMRNGELTWRRSHGYINTTGQFVINPQFDQAYDFRQGQAIVVVDDKQHLINKSGKRLTQEEFDRIEQIYLDSTRLRIIKMKGKYGFMEVHEDCVLAIPPRFDAVRPFSENLAPAKVDGKWGFIDRSGQWAIEPQFRAVYGFSSGLAAVDTGENLLGNNWGFIDKTGNFMIEPQFREIRYGFADGTDNLVCARKRKRWGYIDKTGEFVIEPRFDGIGSFSHGFANVRIGEKTGCIDRSGNIVIEPKWEMFRAFSSAGTAFVEEWVPNNHGGRVLLWGLIDKTGRVLVPPKWKELFWAIGDDQLIPVAAYTD